MEFNSGFKGLNGDHPLLQVPDKPHFWYIIPLIWETFVCFQTNHCFINQLIINFICSLWDRK